MFVKHFKAEYSQYRYKVNCQVPIIQYIIDKIIEVPKLFKVPSLSKKVGHSNCISFKIFRGGAYVVKTKYI